MLFLSLVERRGLALFVAQFGLEVLVAPAKRLYRRKRWVTAISLVLPAFRLLRIVRVARVARLARTARGLRLARLLGAINRSMRALAIGLGRRGLGYLVLLTLLVTITGAAGMYRFELDAPGGPGFANYGTAVWWTAMLLTTMGSDYWPRTPRGAGAVSAPRDLRLRGLRLCDGRDRRVLRRQGPARPRRLRHARLIALPATPRRRPHGVSIAGPCVIRHPDP